MVVHSTLAWFNCLSSDQILKASSTRDGHDREDNADCPDCSAMSVMSSIKAICKTMMAPVRCTPCWQCTSACLPEYNVEVKAFLHRLPQVPVCLVRRASHHEYLGGRAVEHRWKRLRRARTVWTARTVGAARARARRPRHKRGAKNSSTANLGQS